MRTNTARTLGEVFETPARPAKLRFGQPSPEGSSEAGAVGEGGYNRLSLAARAALLLIRAYKLVFSAHFSGACRFVPSCADYARDAVAAYGFARGSWLSFRRLVRCHPLCRGGHDPVPVGVSRPSRLRPRPTAAAGLPRRQEVDP